MFGVSRHVFVVHDFFLRSLSATSERQVTSGFSPNTGFCMWACIMLAMNTILAFEFWGKLGEFCQKFGV